MKKDEGSRIGGQSPRLIWRRNQGTATRSLTEAIDIARKHGVKIPEDVSFSITESSHLPENAWAVGPLLQETPDGFIDWEDHYHPRTRKIPFRIRAEVFESDEAIVAVFGHEMFELAELRSLFDLWPRRRIPAGIYGECVLPNIRSNYHDRAWDYADELVQKMREIQL